MKGRRYKLNIDRLEVCYIAPRDIIEGLEDTELWEREGYRLKAHSEDKIEKVLKVEVQTPGAGWEVFAWLRVGNRFEKKDEAFRYCWISLENEVLYKKGELSYLYWIEEDLKLKFNNITYLEIAIDSSVNYFRRVRSAIRNEDLVPIILGKAYPEMKENINSLLYIHTGDRVRYKTGTMSLKNGKGDMALEIYNKGEEIEESGKQYIRASFGISSGELFRMEVRVRNSALSGFCSSYGCSQYDVYMRLIDDNLLFDLWLYYSNKLFRFKDKRTQVSLLQL